MCDEHTVEDDVTFLEKSGDLSRRSFGVMSMAALGACATSPADAAAVAEQDVKITTPDGVCDAYFVHPAKGKHAAVIIWPDIMGLRPSFRVMGKRLAESGYSVLVVNPFYRNEVSPVVPEGASFTDPAIRGKVVPLMQSLNATTHKTDAVTFVAWLDSQKAVDANRKIGTTGYCMGGPIVMRTAAAVPGRIGAGASFHGGGLVTKNPDSPHLSVPQMKASFLFCVAENDDKADPNVKTVLRETFNSAKLPAEIEVYPAQHGWCSLDFPVYDQFQAERAWARLLVLFDTALA
ncbi:MAG: dienelactone hydrolase family protein [Alphaproteobacteria bacterium]|nr:dienelactone hydrolase family protein [Alphaproteobacteria bacterium]